MATAGQDSGPQGRVLILSQTKRWGRNATVMLRILSSHIRSLSRLAGLGWVCAALVFTQAVPTAHAADVAKTYADWPAAAHRTLGELVKLAGSLVERAASAQAAALQYRIDTVYFRETLRELMLADRARAQAERLPAAFLTDMVRMAAVLDAAAECQSGRYIVCPADLIERLEQQHARVTRGLQNLTGKN